MHHSMWVRSFVYITVEVHSSHSILQRRARVHLGLVVSIVAQSRSSRTFPTKPGKHSTSCETGADRRSLILPPGPRRSATTFSPVGPYDSIAPRYPRVSPSRLARSFALSPLLLIHTSSFVAFVNRDNARRSSCSA